LGTGAASSCLWWLPGRTRGERGPIGSYIRQVADQGLIRSTPRNAGEKKGTNVGAKKATVVAMQAHITTSGGLRAGDGFRLRGRGGGKPDRKRSEAKKEHPKPPSSSFTPQAFAPNLQGQAHAERHCKNESNGYSQDYSRTGGPEKLRKKARTREQT